MHLDHESYDLNRLQKHKNRTAPKGTNEKVQLGPSASSCFIPSVFLDFLRAPEVLNPEPPGVTPSAGSGSGGLKNDEHQASSLLFTQLTSSFIQGSPLRCLFAPGESDLLLFGRQLSTFWTKISPSPSDFLFVC